MCSQVKTALHNGQQLQKQHGKQPRRGRFGTRQIRDRNLRAGSMGCLATGVPGNVAADVQNAGAFDLAYPHFAWLLFGQGLTSLEELTYILQVLSRPRDCIGLGGSRCLSRWSLWTRRIAATCLVGIQLRAPD